MSRSFHYYRPRRNGISTNNYAALLSVSRQTSRKGTEDITIKTMSVSVIFIARGSLEETLSHLAFTADTKYIPVALFEQFEQEGAEIDKMLNGYISFLKKSKQGANEPGAKISEEPAIYYPDKPESTDL